MGGNLLQVKCHECLLVKLFIDMSEIHQLSERK